MAKLSDIKLRDLYFIGDAKHRRAFLKALKEVEDEGFEISDVQTATLKIKDLQERSFVEQKQAANTAKSADLVGATPAELSVSARLKSQAARKYAETNAVDLKNYKYWREDELTKIKRENDRKSGGDDFGKKTSPFDFSTSLPKRQAKKSGASLYDELFGNGDDEDFEPFPKTETYKTIESIMGSDSTTKIETKTKSIRESYLSNPSYKKKIEQNKSLALGIMNEQRLAKANKKQELIDESKKMLMEPVEDVVEQKAEVVEQGKPKTTRAKKADVSSVESEEAKDVSLSTDEAEKGKLVVEVVAPEVPQKPKMARKPRGKAKKKVDHDIMRYHKIKID